MVDKEVITPGIDTRSAAATVDRIDLFTLRLVTYAPRAAVQRWIIEDVHSLSCAPYFTPSLRAAFDALSDEVRRRVLIVDYDALSKEEIVEIRTLRNLVPGGTFILLGQVREHVRAALRATHVLPRPLGSEGLRVIIDGLDRQRDTVKLG
jgi:hypothetical protein